MNYNIGFMGAGGIAKAHAFAIQALPYYYKNLPNIELTAVATSHQATRAQFAKAHSLPKALSPEQLFADTSINTLYILTPNNLHYPQLMQALACKHIKYIYIEKPLGFSTTEIKKVRAKIKSRKDVFIQPGFQFLDMPNVRMALSLKNKLGDLIHFHVRYLHSSYLDKNYRQQRQSRLLPIPHGGALADLGSHCFGFLVAFLGDKLKIEHANSSGRFSDTPAASDLFSQVFIKDTASGAIGSLSASRISAGATDVLEIEMRGTKGAVKLSTLQPDILKLCKKPTSGIWEETFCGNNYKPHSHFPSANVPSGWLRPLIHTTYNFFTQPKAAFSRSLELGFSVQQLINETNKLSTKVMK